MIPAGSADLDLKDYAVTAMASILTVSFLFYLGWCVYRDVRNDRRMDELATRVTERADMAQWEAEGAAGG